MNDITESGSTTRYLLPADFQAVEHEAVRLLRSHARDPLVRMAILFDLHVRRLAYRIIARLRTWPAPRRPQRHSTSDMPGV